MGAKEVKIITGYRSLFDWPNSTTDQKNSWEESAAVVGENHGIQSKPSDYIWSLISSLYWRLFYLGVTLIINHHRLRYRSDACYEMKNEKITKYDYDLMHFMSPDHCELIRLNKM